MRRVLGMAILLVGMSGIAPAPPNRSPEIDPGAARSGLALLAGAALIIRGRRRN